MTPEQYKEVSRLYRAALELEPPRWTDYLAGACGDDEALRQEVESLLSYESRGEKWLDQPAMEAAAKAMVEDQAVPEAPSLIGQSVGHCRILSLLGKGGMGEVYLAEDVHLNRKVAVKLLPAEFTADADRVRRFAQEARAASALNHPNIITIHEIGESEGTHYIITEYVAGETLRQRLTGAPEQRINLTEAIELAAQVAAALAAAHEAGITHRDIKPENVMVRGDGLVKVLDFGLAKLTERKSDGEKERLGEDDLTLALSLHPSIPPSLSVPGVVMGTPRYMSPEQARGEPVDARTDIFSVGVLLYEMIAGRPPFAGATTNDLIAALLRDEPPPLCAASSVLAPIVSQALRKDRDERYQTAKEVVLALKDLTEARAFEARLERISAPESASRTAPASARPESFVSRIKTHSRSLAIALVVLLLALAAIARFTSRGAEPAIDSLAVLPFVNVGGDNKDEIVPDGITETLINNLSQLPHVKVTGRSSAFRYKGREIDPQVAGRALGVRAVLTGNVSQRGDNLHISAELVDVESKGRIWGEQFNVPVADIVVMQEKIARQISEGLRVKITGKDQPLLVKHQNENWEAYRFYLLGRDFWNKFGPENNRKAIENFNLAITQDPNYALAYTGLAKAYGTLGVNGGLPPKEALPQAKAAALKALEINDQLAEAHAVLAGVAMFYERDWAVAERELQQAVALNANDPLTHVEYSYFLTALGRFDEAIAHVKINQQLDPISIPMYANLVRAYYFARRYDEALETNQKKLKMDLSFPILVVGTAYEQKGKYEEAILELQKVNRLLGGFPEASGALGHVYATSGKRSEAIKALEELQVMSKQKYVSPLDLAILYTGLGDKEQAFEQLEKAYEDRSGWLINLKVEPRFDPLRTDPRFADMLRRIGLST